MEAAIIIQKCSFYNEKNITKSMHKLFNQYRENPYFINLLKEASKKDQFLLNYIILQGIIPEIEETVNLISLGIVNDKVFHAEKQPKFFIEA